MVNLVISEPRTRTTDEGAALTRALTLDERWERAFDRAHQMRRNTRFEGPGHYTMLSTRFDKYRYEMRLTGHGLYGWECACPSGGPDTACKHRARLLMRLGREASSWHLYDEPESEGDLFGETNGMIEQVEPNPYMPFVRAMMLKEEAAIFRPDKVSKPDPFAQYKEAMG